MLSLKNVRKGGILLLICLSSALLALLISSTYPFRTIELKWLDQLFEFRGQKEMANAEVVLVAISEQADSELPLKFPYPTSYYARLIENLNKAGARAIGIDVVIDKPDIYDLANDSLLANVINKYGNVVLAGNINIEQNRSFGEEQSSQSTYAHLVTPYPLLQKANPNEWGFVSVLPDRDGFIRQYILKRDFLSKPYYSFGIEILKLYLGLEYDQIKDTEDTFYLGDYQIPKNENGLFHINFMGPSKTFPEYSMDQVIDDATFFTTMEEPDFQINAFDDPEYGLLYTEVFQDKIVLVGATLAELHDVYSTPFAPNQQMAGYEIHANFIKSVLDKDYIYEIPYRHQWILFILLSVFIVLVTNWIKSYWNILILFGISTALILSSIYLFVEQHIYLEIVYNFDILLFGYIGTVVFNYITEQKEKRRIRNMFSTYVSPSLVQKMIESEEEPKLGGDEVEMTAFFSDIQSFSTFSEKLSPTELVDLINEYLTAMTDILSEEGGTLDKYIGDAIVAFFGAPVPMEDHAYRSCITAQRMFLKQKELRDKWRAEGEKWPDVVSQMQTRIGMNTGLMVTGNMGSKNRFNYTMMGDNVNLAARCESGAKSFGVYIMVTEDTYKGAISVGDRCVFRYLDKIVVKGRSQPVKMYEVVGFREDVTDSTYECIRLYEKAMIEHYSKQEWDEAIRLLEQAVPLEPLQPDPMLGVKTNPSMIMLERCKEMAQQNNLPADWDGVYVMTSK